MKAFPRFNSIIKNELGMDLRDYFAAKAMQATLNGTTNYENVAKYAYKMADEMMKAREN